ncbi:MAG: hypothetical protein J5606_08210, partial [Bacteroidales bacterium]|nr:hypothetical protein [Bacteroidales bacterium]
FHLTETGKVVKKPCRDSVTRERQRLKKQAKLYKNGLLNFETIEQSFQSWLGSMKYRNARKTAYNMTILYNNLFGKEVEAKNGSKQKDKDKRQSSANGKETNIKRP